jgi:hypothetical protein
MRPAEARSGGKPEDLKLLTASWYQATLTRNCLKLTGNDLSREQAHSGKKYELTAGIRL